MRQLTWNRAEHKWTLTDPDHNVAQTKRDVRLRCSCGSVVAETMSYDTDKMRVGALEIKDDVAIEANP